MFLIDIKSLYTNYISAFWTPKCIECYTHCHTDDGDTSSLHLDICGRVFLILFHSTRLNVRSIFLFFGGSGQTTASARNLGLWKENLILLKSVCFNFFRYFNGPLKRDLSFSTHPDICRSREGVIIECPLNEHFHDVVTVMITARMVVSKNLLTVAVRVVNYPSLNRLETRY